MAIKAEQLKAELVDRVAARLRERLDPKRAEAAERFLRQFYENVAPDDILGDGPDNLYGAALALWNQGQKRRPGACKTRVYNARPEEQGWKSSHTIVEIINDDMPFLVDSVTAALNRLGAEVYLIIHPILRVERDARGKLVHRDAGPDVVSFGLLRVHAGQKRPGGSRMVARAFARPGNSFLAAEATDHQHPVSKRRERLQRPRDVQDPTFVRRGPSRHEDAVRHIDDAKTANRLRRTRARGAKGRHHAVQHRQRQRHADATQECATREVLLGDNHGSRVLLI